MARIGMRHLVYAPIATETAGNVPTYSTGAILGRAVRGAVTQNRFDAKLYGDDALAEAYNGVRDMSVEIESTELEEANMAALGLAKTGGTGDTAYYRVTEDPAGYIGLGWVQVMVRKNVMAYKAVWLYKVQLGPAQEESRTRGENLEYGTASLTGSAFGLSMDSSGVIAFEDFKVFTTLTSAISWLNTKAGISS